VLERVKKSIHPADFSVREKKKRNRSSFDAARG
jgi:hypothetical protein